MLFFVVVVVVFLYFYLWKKIRHDVSCESSARQRIHMKYQVLFCMFHVNPLLGMGFT